MKLTWKSYGDTGLTAKGKQGRWTIVTGGIWWHLTLHSADGPSTSEGKFGSRPDAQSHAQDREDSVEVKAR